LGAGGVHSLLGGSGSGTDGTATESGWVQLKAGVMSAKQDDESGRDMYSRLNLIALGERDCDMSDNDIAALRWMLVMHGELLDALKKLADYAGGYDEYADIGLAQRISDAISVITKAEGRK
jgi:hypothetical protein